MFQFKIRGRSELRYLTFHPEGRLLLANGQLWDLTSHKMISELKDFPTWSSRATFLDDGQRIVRWQFARGVDIIKLESEEIERLIESSSDTNAATGPNNTLFVSRGGYQQTPFLALWNVAEPKPVLLWKTEEHNENAQLPYAPHLAISPDAQTFAAVEIHYHPYRIQRLLIKSIETGESVRAIAMLGGWTHFVGLHYHPSGEQLLLISDKNIYVYSIQKGTVERTIQKPKGGTFQSFVMHPNRRFFLSLHRLDGMVNIWNADTLEIIRSFEWPIRKGATLAISPDGLTCAVGDSQGNVVVWDWED